MKSLRDRVLQQISESSAVSTVQGLVRLPSVNPPGTCEELGDFVTDLFQRSGLAVQKLEIDKGKPNIIGNFGKAEGRPALLLQGHMDVVPVSEGEKWDVPPFEGMVRGGRIYGRGAADMKGGLGAMIEGVRAVLMAGPEFKRNLRVIASVDEETGGHGGMEALAERGYGDVNMAIICEPSELKIMRSFKGRGWYRFAVRGKGAHASMPHRGINAIVKMAKIITAVSERGLRFEPHDMLGASTLSWGTIAGGTKVNVVPDTCVSMLDVRLVPGQTTTSIEMELKDMVKELVERDPELQVDVRYTEGKDPVEIAPTEPIVHLLSSVGREVLKQTPQQTGMISSGDYFHIYKRGVPGVFFGPGSLEAGNSHGANEHILINELVNAARIYALTILEACCM